MAQNKHYFQGNDFYYLKDIIPYIKKKAPSLSIPDCWQTGGSLNEKVRCEYGILPAWTNMIEGRGHREKYTGAQMYEIATCLIQDLKDGIIKRRHSRALTPIEALAKGGYEVNKVNKKAFEEIIDKGQPIKVPVYPVSSKDDLQRALKEESEKLVQSFQDFINQIIKAYMESV